VTLAAGALGALAAALAAGCSRSPVQPNQTVIVHGAALHADGTPEAGSKVTIWDGDLTDALLSLFITAITPVDDTHADFAGDYALVVDGRLANGFFGARTFSIDVGPVQSLSPDSPDTSVSFHCMQTLVDVPTLQAWDGNPQAAAGATDVVFSWEDLAVRTGVTADGYDVTFGIAGVPSTAVEHWTGTSTAWSVPRHALQEFAWRFQVTAARDDGGSGTTFHRAYRGRAIQVAGVNPPPPTRGRPAWSNGSPANALTDGNLFVAAVQNPGVGPQLATAPLRIEVDLGAPLAPSVVDILGIGVDPNAGPIQATVSLAPAVGQTGVVIGTALVAADPLEIPLAAPGPDRVLVIEFPSGVVSINEVVAY
jgi:hypothetical protein